MYIFDSEVNPTQGDVAGILRGGRYLINAVFGGSMGGGTLTIEVINKNGDRLVTPDDLVTTELPQGIVVWLGNDSSIQAKLAGATSPDLKLWLSRLV